MSSVLVFGEQIEGYSVRVLKERAVRASAGILFFLATVSFMNAWLTGNFQPTRVFVVGFLMDLSIRICIGCKLYNLMNKEQAQLCPGGVCAVHPAPRAAGGLAQGAIAIAFAALVGVVAVRVAASHPRTAAMQATAAAGPATPIDPVEAERCKVPDFAKAIGHEEKWKLHNNCK